MSNLKLFNYEKTLVAIEANVAGIFALLWFFKFMVYESLSYNLAYRYNYGS